MKNLKYYLVFIFIITYVYCSSIVSQASEYIIYGEYSVGNLTLTSYSKSWNTEGLKELYLELLNNFHGDEFNYLKNIYIYPDSPHGVNGYYKEHSYIGDNGYVLGDSASIEIFNGDILNTLDKIAPVLSHEYGHHYTIYNIFKYEGIYLNNYENSEYYKIRNLANYPVYLEYKNSDEYIYYWDILELLAYDYVQLLGSSKAKQSTYYKDLRELAEEGLSVPNVYTNSFNLKPQINPYLPLASEVKGLYNYFLKISGFTSTNPSLEVYPQITEVNASKTIDNKVSFEVNWSEALGSGTLEYTVVMSPSNNPFSVIPIKTVYGDEELSAVFGNYAVLKEDGSIYSVSHPYLEEVVLRVYVKDAKGFIYSSEPFVCNLKELSDSITNESFSSSYNKTSLSNNNSLSSSKVKIYTVEPNIPEDGSFILKNSVLKLLESIKKRTS